MRDKYLDRLLITFSVAALLFSFFYMIYGRRTNYKENVLSTIAHLTKINRDVRIKPIDQFDWSSAGKNKITDNTKLFTGDKSSAEILFEDKTKIQMDANSLVTIAQYDKEIVLDIKYGTFTGNLGKRTKMTIISGGVKKELTAKKNSKVNITVSSSGETKITIIDGEIGLKSKNEDITIRDHYIAVLDKDKSIHVQKNYGISLKLPLDGQQLTKLKEDIKFTWDSYLPVESYYFELSDMPDFSNILFSKHVSNNQLKSDNLPYGEELYWRVSVSDSHENLDIKSRSFIIKKDRPSAELVLPENDKKIVGTFVARKKVASKARKRKAKRISTKKRRVPAEVVFVEPIITPVPVPETVESFVVDLKVRRKPHKVKVVSGLTSKKIDATESGNSLTATSDIGKKVGVSFEHLFNNEMFTFIDLSYTFYSFNVGYNNTVLADKGWATSNFGIGGGFKKNKYDFGLSLYRDNELFLISTGTAVKMDDLGIYSFLAFLRRNIYSYKNLDFIPTLTIGTLQFGKTSRGDNVSGSLGKISFEVGYKQEWGEVNSILFYEHQSLKSDAYSGTLKESGLKISLGKSF